MLREMAVAGQGTAAPLRLALRPAGADALAVQLLKRRGPPLESPLLLGLPPVLSAAARQRSQVGVLSPVLPPVMHAATFVHVAEPH
ncbi:hypothetical protein BH11PSE8_BH11PSE8_10780 [soil metagenome]